MNYVVEKYGRERVAQIITFGKLAAKAATRDTGRVLGLPFGVVDRIAKMIPEGPKVGFDDCLKPGQDLQTAYDDPASIGQDSQGRSVTTRQLIDMARPLEGLVRQDSIHAAARRDRRPRPVRVPAAAAQGRRRADRHAVRDGRRRGARPAQDGLPRPAQPRRHRRGRAADRASRAAPSSTWSSCRSTTQQTYAMLARGDATGVFQFESSGMRDALRQVKPTEFDDLIALVALYRPGPDAEHPGVRARARTASEPVTYLDDRLEDRSLAHVRRVRLPGAGDADRRSRWPASRPPRPTTCARRSARRASSLMASLKERFLEGCVANARAGARPPSCSGTRTSAAPTTRSTSRTPPATR